MNRRSFFQLVTGLVAGVYTACVPKKAKALTVEHLMKCRDELVVKNKRDMTEIYGIPPGWTANEWAEAHTKGSFNIILSVILSII